MQTKHIVYVEVSGVGKPPISKKLDPGNLSVFQQNIELPRKAIKSFASPFSLSIVILQEIRIYNK